MKNVIMGTALLILAITIAACQQAANPVSPVSLNKNNIQATDAANNGTLEITSPDSRTFNQSGILTGSIYFEFDNATSSYKYRGSINTPATTANSYIFENTGKFEISGDNIKLIDNPLTENRPGIQSLYLNGDFHYNVQGMETTIEGDSPIGHIKIILH
jgi:hypothetical protein